MKFTFLYTHNHNKVYLPNFVNELPNYHINIYGWRHLTLPHLKYCQVFYFPKIYFYDHDGFLNFDWFLGLWVLFRS